MAQSFNMRSRFIRVIFAAVLLHTALFSFSANAQPASQKGLGKLKAWAGKAPRNPSSARFRDFFALPEIKRLLTKILPDEDIKAFVAENFHTAGRIELIEGYLVVMGRNKPDASAARHTQLAINLRSGLANIWHVEGEKMWGSGTIEGELPAAIEDKIMKYRKN